jgi:hypothetical protein
MQKRDPKKKSWVFVARVSQNEKLLVLGIGWKLIDIRKGERNKKKKFHSSLNAFSKFSSSVYKKQISCWRKRRRSSSSSSSFNSITWVGFAVLND